MRSFAGARFHCKQLDDSQREAERLAGDYIPRPDGATLLAWGEYRLCLRRLRRIDDSRCRRCDYNLTGLTEPRCPECGQPFEARDDAP